MRLVIRSEGSREIACRRARREGWPGAHLVMLLEGEEESDDYAIALTANLSLLLYSGSAARPFGNGRRRLASLQAAGVSVAELAQREGVRKGAICRALQRQRKEALEYGAE